MTKRDRENGKCVRTMAEPATLREWLREQPEVNWKGFCGWKFRYETDLPSDTIIRQRGNGSVRLLYPISKRAGGGSFKPFAFPVPYPRIGERGFHKAVTDREAMAKDERAYLASIGWFGWR